MSFLIPQRKPKLKSSRYLEIVLALEIMNWLWSINDLPVEILSRLPTENLIALKCVAKDWKSVISEPSLLEKKLQIIEPLSGFFIQERYQWSDEDINTISYIRRPNNNTGRTKIQCQVFDFLPHEVVLLAVCNGLICCRRSSLPSSQPAVYICNPLNKEWVTVQWPDTKSLMSLGLAFDPLKDVVNKTTTFKVVRVHQIEINDIDDMDDSYHSIVSFEVYSSKTGMFTKLNETFECGHKLYKNKGIYVKGRGLFWLTDGNQIFMFDTENDVARVVEAPVPRAGFNRVPEMCIGVSEEKLHYVVISKDGLLVWALEDYIDFDWELKYFVDLDEMERENYEFLCNVKERVAERKAVDMNPWVNPLAYYDGILFMRVSAKMYLYHFENRKMEKLCNISDLGQYSMFTPIVLPYSMSLVPLAWP